MEYTKADIADLLNKRKRTIQYWTDIGLVVPDIEPSQGRGRARVYSDRNLVEFAMVEYLSRLHIELATIKNILAGLRKGSDKFKDDAGKTQQISFSDFYKNKAWGETKELAFVEAAYQSKKEVRSISAFRVMQVISENEPRLGAVEGLFSSYRSTAEVVQRFIWLGEIKRRAVTDLLGMTSLIEIQA